ncbi:hypothetical protein BS78_03G384600 [Paspalum vaginatum]|nr:hypothetical protein BS78_03G384600 [Paspalum vaginatum]
MAYRIAQSTSTVGPKTPIHDLGMKRTGAYVLSLQDRLLDQRASDGAVPCSCRSNACSSIHPSTATASKLRKC